MASLNLTSFDAALKQHYTRDRVENMVYARNPLMAMLPKMERFGGKNLPIPIIYGNPSGRSAKFSAAQNNKNPSQITDFVLTRDHDYGLASIDNETLLASQGDSEAFMEAATTEIDGTMHAVTRSAAKSLYRDGSGAIARLGNASFATTAMTLADTSDVVNFEVNMEIQFSSDATFGNIRDSGAALTVTAVNRRTGAITVGANLSTISGIAQNDYISPEGDLEEGMIKGLDAWIPETVTATSFFGVDRTADASRLAGQYEDLSSLPIEEALVEATSQIEQEGGAPDYVFMNFPNLSNLKKALGSKVVYQQVEARAREANVGFKGVMIDGNAKPIVVLGDQNAPNNFFYELTIETDGADVWKLYSLGMCPQILDSDGLKMLRESSSDGVELRVGYYAQLGCRAPGWSGKFKIN